jgi:DNA-binding response OmpR family regulator
MAQKILIVDDDTTWRKMLVRALGDAGYDVFEAADGRVGLEICRQHWPGLVITDVFMPEPDGLEIIQALRKSDHKPKMLAMSGGGFGGQLDLLSAASGLGADKVLRKPFGPSLLLEVVRELIGNAQETSP